MRSRSRAEEKPHRTLNDTGINHGQTRHNTPVACNVTTLIEIIDHPVQAYTHKKIFNLVAEQTINLIVLGCVLVSTCIIVSLSWVSGRYLNYRAQLRLRWNIGLNYFALHRFIVLQISPDDIKSDENTLQCTTLSASDFE